MIRITRLTDYGIILMAEIAQTAESHHNNVPDLAEATRLPLPTVGKVLKALAREGLVVSYRGAKGGYRLARRPETISVVEIIGALDGPIAITECNNELPGKCELERCCPVRANWQKINVAVRESLEKISLADMMQPKVVNVIPIADIALMKERSEVLETCQ